MYSFVKKPISLLCTKTLFSVVFFVFFTENALGVTTALNQCEVLE